MNNRFAYVETFSLEFQYYDVMIFFSSRNKWCNVGAIILSPQYGDTAYCIGQLVLELGFL